MVSRNSKRGSGSDGSARSEEEEDKSHSPRCFSFGWTRAFGHMGHTEATCPPRETNRRVVDRTPTDHLLSVLRSRLAPRPDPCPPSVLLPLAGSAFVLDGYDGHRGTPVRRAARADGARSPGSARRGVAGRRRRGVEGLAAPCSDANCRNEADHARYREGSELRFPVSPVPVPPDSDASGLLILCASTFARTDLLYHPPTLSVPQLCQPRQPTLLPSPRNSSA